MGEKWDKATALKAFKDEGHSINTDKYSENGVYYAMNMVYSDYFPMYKDDVEKYVEHAYLFLNDKDTEFISTELYISSSVISFLSA